MEAVGKNADLPALRLTRQNLFDPENDTEAIKRAKEELLYMWGEGWTKTDPTHYGNEKAMLRILAMGSPPEEEGAQRLPYKSASELAAVMFRIGGNNILSYLKFTYLNYEGARLKVKQAELEDDYDEFDDEALKMKKERDDNFREWVDTRDLHAERDAIKDDGIWLDRLAPAYVGLFNDIRWDWNEGRLTDTEVREYLRNMMIIRNAYNDIVMQSSTFPRWFVHQIEDLFYREVKVKRKYLPGKKKVKEFRSLDWFDDVKVEPRFSNTTREARWWKLEEKTRAKTIEIWGEDFTPQRKIPPVPVP